MWLDKTASSVDIHHPYNQKNNEKVVVGVDMHKNNTIRSFPSKLTYIKSPPQPRKKEARSLYGPVESLNGPKT